MFVLFIPLSSSIVFSPQWLRRRFSALEHGAHPPPTQSKREELDRELEMEMEQEPEPKPELEQEPEPRQV